MHPDLVPYRLIDGDGVSATYDVNGKPVVNGDGGISSKELLNAS